jgi:hypothetical protein
VAGLLCPEEGIDRNKTEHIIPTSANEPKQQQVANEGVAIKAQANFCAYGGKNRYGGLRDKDGTTRSPLAWPLGKPC